MLQKSGRLVLWEAMFILELHSAETQDKNPALTLFIVQNFPLPSFHSSFNIVKYTTNKRITMRREHIYEKIQLLP